MVRILGTKDDMKENFIERLGHGANDNGIDTRSESRFQRWRFFVSPILGRRPRLQ
jgi:hypothetical protein